MSKRTVSKQQDIRTVTRVRIAVLVAVTPEGAVFYLANGESERDDGELAEELAGDAPEECEAHLVWVEADVPVPAVVQGRVVGVESVEADDE